MHKSVCNKLTGPTNVCGHSWQRILVPTSSRRLEVTSLWMQLLLDLQITWKLHSFYYHFRFHEVHQLRLDCPVWINQTHRPGQLHRELLHTIGPKAEAKARARTILEREARRTPRVNLNRSLQRYHLMVAPTSSPMADHVASSTTVPPVAKMNPSRLEDDVPVGSIIAGSSFPMDRHAVGSTPCKLAREFDNPTKHSARLTHLPSVRIRTA